MKTATTIKKRNKRESEIEEHLKKEAARHGFLCWKFSPMYLEGVPDRLLIGHGKVLFIELKREKGGVLSDSQKLRHKQIRDHGGTVHTCSSTHEINEMLSHYA